MCSSLRPWVLVLVVAGLVSAQEEVQQAKAGPNGTWKWEREFNGNKIDYTLQLKWSENKLTGTYKTIFENGPEQLREPVEIKDGKVDGDKVSFAVTRRFNDNEFTITYSGKLTDDKITGVAAMNRGDNAREFEWTAKRVVTIDDVVGKWNAKIETPERVIEPSFTFAKQGDKLTGTYHSTTFGDNPIDDIELKENKLSFAVTIKNDNGEFTVKYKAEPRGDQIAGVVTANFGGQEYEMTFAGSRAATPKAAADAAADDDDDDDDDDDEK